MTTKAPIALFDSGLGGLTVLAELRRKLPHERFVYLGDTARTPYGSKSQETVRRYSLQCARFLEQQDVKLLVVACNTASAFALETLRSECAVPVIGTIEPAAKSACAISSRQRIGIIATEATIQSDVFRRVMEEITPEAVFFSKECPLFVPFVEQGITAGPLVEQVIEMYLSSVRNLDIDTLVLGCTHYPMLRGALRKFFGPEIALVDCATTTADAVMEFLQEAELLAEPTLQSVPKRDLFYVTDSGTRFKHLAAQFLGDPVVEVLTIDSFDGGKH